MAKTFSFEEATAAAPETFSFEEAIGAKRDLPEGVKPSEAGAGRGSVNPPAVRPSAPEAFSSDRARRIAEMEAETDPTNPDYLPVTRSAQRALQTDARGGMDAKRTKSPGRVLDADVPPISAETVVRDVASGALQIGPTAVKGVGEVVRMATGDRAGKGITEFAERGTEAIQDSVGSERAAAQRRRMAQDMQDPALSPADAVVGNPGALADQVLPTVGSMILPVGAAKVADIAATSSRAARVAAAIDPATVAARAAAARAGATTGAVVGQNAGSTFSEVRDKKGTVGEAYTAAAITAPFTYIASRLTGGGAEGQIARGMAGQTAQRTAAAVPAAMLREGGQEIGEQAGQSLGQAVGEGEPLDLQRAGKEMAVAGTLGAVVGGSMDLTSAAVDRLNKAGDKEVARLLQRRIDAELASKEIGAMGEAAAHPRFQEAYRAQRTSGLKPAEAAARAAMFTGFDELAEQAGLSQKALAAAREKAQGMPLDEVPEYLERVMRAFAARGLGQPIEPGAVSSATAALRDDAVTAAVQGIYTEAPAAPAQAEAVDNIARILGVQPAAGTEPAAAPAATTPEPGWERFAPETGTLGIPRAEMPQIKAEAHGPLVNFLNARGIAHETHSMDPGTLKPSQAEYSPERVDQIGAEKTGRSVLVSADGFIVDGHHTVLAAIARGEPVKAIVLQAPFADLVERVREFPSAQAEAAQAAQAAPVETAAPAPVDPGAEAGGQADGAELRGGAPRADTGGQPAAVEATGPYGRDGTPLADGGKPFRTNAEASRHRKKYLLQMRTIKVDGGFALRDMTERELAASLKAAKRLSKGNTGETGPESAHAFIARRGGLSKDEMADAGFDRNMRIGSLWLFGAPGKGMSIERATEALIEAGYLPEGSLHNAAYDLIRRSATQLPQFTPEGWESIAQAEQEQRFEDFLAAQQEDPGEPLDGLDDADLAGTEVEDLTPDEQEAFAALIEANDAMGVDDALLERVRDSAQNEDSYDENEALSEDDAARAFSEGSDRGESAQPGRRAPEPESDPGGKHLRSQQGAAPRSDQGQVAPAATAPVQTPAAAGVSFSGFEFERNASGALAVLGEPDAVARWLTDRGVTRFMKSSSGVLVSHTEADKAEKLLTKAKGKPAPAPKEARPLALGTTPGDAEAVTVKDGIVYVGKYEALDFDSGEPVRVPEGATDAQVKQALKDAGVLGGKQKFFGGAKDASDAFDSPMLAMSDEDLTAPTKEDVLAQQARAQEAERTEAKRRRDEAQKAAADSQRNDFTLTGSDRAADANPGQGTLFARGGVSPEQRAANFSAWSNGAPMVDSKSADTYSFKSGEKVVVEAFHGTKRPDRIGTVFNPKRATSGPMAYFTSAPVLASSYAQGKDDTSLRLEETPFESWFKVAPPKGTRTPLNIDRAWSFLDAATKQRIADLAPRVMMSDDGMEVVLGPEGETRGNGAYDHELQQTRTSYDRLGNPLKALVESWLTSGALFGNEIDFLQVLEKAGFPVETVTFDSPNAEMPFVYHVHIAMRKPLVTSDIPTEVTQALNAAAKRDRSRAQQGGADAWDKNTRTLREWVENLNNPADGDSKYVWTSIPDKVTDVLRSLGYDGIIDWSGKGGGTSHPVYIPFGPTQVKSAIGNKGTFDSAKKDILLSRNSSAKRPGLPAGLNVSAREGMATVEQARKIVDSLTAKWKNPPKKVHVVATARDLPIEAPSDARGLYMGGEVWVVAGAHQDTSALRSSIAKTLAHEAIAHHGLRDMLGRDDWNRLMKQVQLALDSGNKPLGEIRAYVREAYVDEYGNYMLNPAQESDEVAARAVEQAIDENGELRPGFGFLKAVYAKIAEFLRSIGIDVKFTNAELQGILVLSMRNLEGGKRVQGGGQQLVAAARKEARLLRVFHGSPHEFDAFDLKAIGTGEGAQAYGWGLYFAGRKEVAEHYRRTLSGSRRSIAYGPVEAMRRQFAGDTRYEIVPDTGPLGDGNAYVYKTPGRMYEVEIPEEGSYLLWDKPLSEQPEQVRKALQAMKGGATTLDQVLAGKSIPELLKWVDGFDRNNSFDEMLEDDPDMTADDVREAIKESYDEADMAAYLGSGDFESHRTGESIYRALSSKTGSDEAASRALAAAGVPGIKYLDGASRGNANYQPQVPKYQAKVERLMAAYKAEPTSENASRLEDARQELESARRADEENAGHFNYVVFDDKAVKIEAMFAKSPMKSPDANIRRGREAMNKAILEKADQRRAMHRTGLGWVDFVWGDDKKGLQHILLERQRKDGVTRQQGIRMLTENIVETIAAGEETRRRQSGKGINLEIEKGGYRAVLVGRQGSNGWLLTGFELVPGERGEVFDSSAPTLSKPTVTRQGEGAGTEDIVPPTTGSGASDGFDTDGMLARGDGKDQTETEAFKRWFGDSKVVDADGKPLVVYHGTTGNFNAFDLTRAGAVGENFGRAAYFSSDAGVAASYTARWMGDPEFVAAREAEDAALNAWGKAVVAHGKGSPEAEAAKARKDEAGVVRRKIGDEIDAMQRPIDGANVMPAYLALQNPLVVEGGGRYFFQVYKDSFAKARSQGNDGVIFRSVIDSANVANQRPSDIYVAFRPEQIKSAIGNRGTFDPNDSDIRFARGAPAANAGAQPAPAAAQSGRPLSRWRDATGRVQFAPGQALYDLIGKAADPLLSKLQLKAASPELRRALRAMKVEVAKAQETAAAVAGEANKLTPAEREMVSDLVEKELAAGTIPPGHAVRLATLINDVMGRQTDELVRLGMLTQESADRWKGEYLPRFYESRLTKKAADAWADAMRRIVGRTRAMKGIQGKHLRGRGLYETIPESELPAYEALGWEVRDPDYQPGLPTMDGTVQVWRDFTRAERDNMGEIRDAGFRFVMGYMQTQRDIALGRMFEQLAANPEISSRTETEKFGVQVPDTKVAGTGAKVYGKLAGRWVSKDTLSHLSAIDEAQSEALQMYRKALGIWKESKTVLNPVSHVNNILSNVTMAHFAGVSYLDAHKYVGAARDLATKSAMVTEAKDAGLFLGTLSEAELQNMLPPELRALAQQQEGTAAKLGRSGFNLMTFFLRKPMGWAYQAEDSFFRYLVYRDARKNGASPQDAVDYAQKYIFTYDDLPKGARIVRDFALPFFSYTYKAAPALLHTALTHPLRFAAPAAVLWAANAAAYAIAAGDDDDDWQEALKKYLTDPAYRAKARAQEQLEREHLPPWMKGTTALMTPKTIRLGTDEVTKLPVFIDMARVIPGGDLFDVSPNAGGLPIPQPITPSHPLFTTAVAMLGNKDLFTGKPLVDTNDTRAEAAEKRGEWLWKQITPAITAGNYHWERGMNAIAQATGSEVTWMPDALGGDATGIGRDGLPVQPKYAAMQTFGIKVRPIDVERAEEIEGSMREKMLRDIETELRSLKRLNAIGAIGDRAFDKASELAETKKERIKDGLTVDGDEKP